MSESLRTKDGVETVIDDHSLAPLRCDAKPAREKLTNTVNAAFKRAKRASETENARARKIVCALRAKPAGDDSRIVMTKSTGPPSTSVQGVLSDFV